MSVYKVKYLHIAVDTVEIEANNYNSAVSEFMKSHPKSPDTIYHVMDVKESVETSEELLPQSDNCEKFGDIIINHSCHEIWKNSSKISLSDREYDIFVYLLENIAGPKSAPEILKAVYGYDPTTPSDTKVINTMVARIRKKLRTINTVLEIECLRGLGYMIKIKSD